MCIGIFQTLLGSLVEGCVHLVTDPGCSLSTGVYVSGGLNIGFGEAMAVASSACTSTSSSDEV